MNKRRKQLLADLKKICSHFKLNFSKVEVVRKSAFALDTAKKKLLLLNENDPYFKTIDLRNVDGCAIKVDYGRINAGDLDEREMNNFIDKVQLQISHLDPAKSVNIGFYDTEEDNVSELQELIDRATQWKDKISAMIPSKLHQSLSLHPAP
jgi:hypothetical protein